MKIPCVLNIGSVGLRPRNVSVLGGMLGLACATVAPLTMRAAVETPTPPAVTITVSPTLPSDIAGGAPNATLTQAAAFAWQEFIALNWPAVPQMGVQGNREAADTTKFFGDPAYTTAAKPLVWHTYRGKVEIFPGQGFPPGGTGSVVNGAPVLANLAAAGATPYYGYDALPSYVYANGPIPPMNGTPSATPPWINLDEISQIGLDQIYAGVASANTGIPGNQILFLAKAGRAEFDYLAPLGWWSGNAPLTATQAYIQKNLSSPPAGSTDYVSFPNGTVELKAAWRKLASTEDASRFYTTKVRYYVSNGGVTQYVDDTLALVALHIIQKTPTAPYFIFATFEQADNITDANGKPVEDADGNFIGMPAPATPFTPNIVSQNATPGGFQTFQPAQSPVTTPQSQLYYQNLPNLGLTEGTVLVNQRKHPISSDVIAVNVAAHQAIASYVTTNLPAGTTTPWSYYKLVSVQSAPISGKIAGQDYTKADASTFYQANSVVETDYDLQVFSGRFFPASFPATLANTITDYNADGTPFLNVAHGGNGYNMGGCMGCHGNAQHGGGDFSFILLGGPVASPDVVTGGNGGVGAKAPSAKAGVGTKPIAKPSIQKYPLKP